MPKKKNGLPCTPTEWVEAKWSDYEYSMKKQREKEHKLFKREFINAFLAEHEKEKRRKCRSV